MKNELSKPQKGKQRWEFPVKRPVWFLFNGTWVEGNGTGFLSGPAGNHPKTHLELIEFTDTGQSASWCLPNEIRHRDPNLAGKDRPLATDELSRDE